MAIRKTLYEFSLKNFCQFAMVTVTNYSYKQYNRLLWPMKGFLWHWQTWRSCWL